MSRLYDLRSVSKHHSRGGDKVVIFEDLNLHIDEREFITIMGPSGSGKTTLLNLLGGIDQPSSGEVLFKGEHLERLSEAKLTRWRARNVGFVFQFYNLMPMLTARQNVELPLMLTSLSAPARKQQVETALEIVGLTDRGRHYPRQLSGGQQQRVAIARALVADPAVLLCDEPTGDLDRVTANEILEVLQLLNSEFGKTIVMVTHDPAAAKFSRKTLRLDKMRFIEEEVEIA